MGGRIGWAGEKRFPKVPLQLPARIRTVCTGNTFGVDVETTLCLSGFVAERKAFPPTRWTPFPPPQRTRWALPYPPSALTMVAPQRACAAYRTVFLSTMAPYTRTAVVALAPCLGSFQPWAWVFLLIQDFPSSKNMSSLKRKRD